MRLVALMFLFSIATASADFGSDKYTDHPDALFRIVTAASNDEHFKSYTDGTLMALYLQKAEFIGTLTAPFGSVQVARLFFIRSAPLGSRAPPRGHTYIVFLDNDFKIRDYWAAGMPDEPLSIDGNKLVSDKTVILDYLNLPANGSVEFNGDIKPVPRWDKK